MVDWCPQTTGVTKRRWYSTSKAKSGPCVSYNPLEELRNSAKHLLASEGAKHLSVTYKGPLPKQEDLLVLLGMWVHIVVKYEACGPIELLNDMAPQMSERAKDRWAELLENLDVSVKED